MLTATIGKTLLQVDKAKLFAHHEGRDKVKGIAGDIIEESVLGCKKDSKQEPDILVDGVLTELKTTGMIEPKKVLKLHNEEVPISSTEVFPEILQRIPVIVYIVSNANSTVPSVVFQPTSNARRGFQLNSGILFEKIDYIFSANTDKHLSSTHYYFLHCFNCSNNTP